MSCEPTSRQAFCRSVLLAKQRRERADHLEPDARGLQCRAVGDHHEHAAALLVRVLARFRRERDRIEADARETPRIQRRRQPRSVDPRRADLFERLIGAAPDGDVRVLDGADAGIQRRLVEVAHVRRRIDPRETRVVVPVIALPPVHRNHREVGADLPLLVIQTRQLAHRHTVANRHRHVGNERVGSLTGARLGRQRAFDLPAVHGIRAIEHHDGNLLPRGLLHHVAHRELIGVEADADVLQIDDDGIEAGEGSFDRPAGAALIEQGVNRQTRLLILRRRHIVIEHAADAVLGTEERDQLHIGSGMEKIDRRLPVTRSAGVIGHEADAFAAKLLEAVADENVDAGQDRAVGPPKPADTTVSGLEMLGVPRHPADIAAAATVATLPRNGVTSPVPSGWRRLERKITISAG